MELDENIPFWVKKEEEILTLLEADLSQGLSQEQVLQRRSRFGENILPKPKRGSKFFLFLTQFTSPLVLLLLGACLVSSLLGEWLQASAIFAILLLNAIVGFIQEFRAEKSFEALSKLLTFKTKVIRGGSLREVFSSEIVLGDLVLLEAGDQVPADGRVIQTIELATQEAALTGESTAVHKTKEALQDPKAEIGDRKNFVFLGTEVVSGKGKFLVTATGKRTELGKIAKDLQEKKKEKTPLQKRLHVLGKHLLFLTLALVTIIFLMGIFFGKGLAEMFLISVSLAVAAIPEGLPAVVTISLAVGVQKMARKKALIRRLSSVETLGCTSIICSDKTGTLTQNQMVLKEIWCADATYQLDGIGYEPLGKIYLDQKPIDPKNIEPLNLAFRVGTLCNNANLYEETDGWKILGDPMEAAILVGAAKGGIWKTDLERKFPLSDEIPFDTERKRMSVISGEDLYIKGAPDVLMERSSSIYLSGKKEPLTEKIKEKLHLQIEKFAKKGLRVLAACHGKGKEETDLVFLALFAFIDPPRKEVKEALERCKQAHISIAMITGDHKLTAMAIAKEIGLLSKEKKAMDGKEISELSQEALEDRVLETSVFARVSAHHKMRIIQAFKKHQKVIAMTGDGVNDAPAIQQADIGISMGITGTDVTKTASDMVLLDDRFSTIVNAVEEGRSIFNNIRKFVFFLLSANFAELFALFFGVLIGFTFHDLHHVIPLTAVQILWINLVTDGLPGIALAFDPSTKNTMKRPPREMKEPFLTLQMGIKLILIGSILGLATLFAAYFGFRASIELGQTMAFTGLVFFELILVWFIRYPLSLRSNNKLIGAVAVSFALQLLVVYVPFFQKTFQTVSLDLIHWGVLVLLGVFTSLFSFLILRWKKAKV